jgi:hypothetical protein
MTPLPSRNFMQICWVVPDLQAAIDGWVRASGVGPFCWFDNVPFVNGRYRGKPAAFPDIKAAIAYAGDMQIELVCQDNDEPSIFRELVPRGRSALHHMGVYCTDYEAEQDAYLKAGAELAFEGTVRGVRTCWLDTTPTLGFMVELLEPHPTRAEGFAKMHEAAQNWDGKNPIIRY